MAKKAGRGTDLCSKLGRPDAYIERAEFRLMLVYLSRYFELRVLFASEVGANDRRVIDREEFVRCAAVLADSWGLEYAGDPGAGFDEFEDNPDQPYMGTSRRGHSGSSSCGGGGGGGGGVVVVLCLDGGEPTGPA